MNKPTLVTSHHKHVNSRATVSLAPLRTRQPVLKCNKFISLHYNSQVSRTVHRRQAAGSGIRDALGNDHESDANSSNNVILRDAP